MHSKPIKVILINFFTNKKTTQNILCATTERKRKQLRTNQIMRRLSHKTNKQDLKSFFSC